MLQICKFKSRQTQVLANGVIVIALVFGFYYIAWQTLRIPNVDHVATDSLTSGFSPAVVLPTPVAPKLDIPGLDPTISSKPPHSSTPPISEAHTPPSAPPATFNPYDRTKVAFLVETRPLPHLPALFAHMMSVIPPEWTFKFMGGPLALEFMRANPLLSQYKTSGKLSLLELPSNYSMKDRDTISKMFTDPYLYADILAPAEHLLVFQPDSIFCAGAPKTLNDFLEYDWIGAPWSATARHGGNGGLSLRKVSKILQVLEKKRRVNTGMPFEDEWLSNELNALPGARMAIANVSKSFSVESVWDDAPLGYHIGWMGVHHPQIWDKQNQVDHILRYCPEVKIILGMKLANDKPQAIQDAEKEEAEKLVAGTEVPKTDEDNVRA